MYLTNETKEAKIEKLTDWINEQGQWLYDYQDHEDNLASYAELAEKATIFYGEIDRDVREEVKTKLDKMSMNDIFDYCEVELTIGYHCRENEIWSYTLGELECQLTGIYSDELNTNCVYTLLCEGLTDDEIKKAGDACGWCVSGDCLYVDRSYDRVSIILDVDKLLSC